MAPLNIERLPGEHEADFRRRYCREKMRIYRARKPKEPRKAKAKNSWRRSDATFTDVEWAELQQRPGESEAEHRRRYNRDKMRLWRQKNPAKVRESARRHYRANTEKELARNARYRTENVVKIKAMQRNYYRANADARNRALKAWGIANAERLAAAKKAWNEANRALLASYSAKWRKAARMATPAWADLDLIRAFYEEAVQVTVETGVQHHVDHIIPLQGKTVCGLHVQTNLRVIPATENVRKRNRLIEELIAA